jgi:hypothetical protein
MVISQVDQPKSAEGFDVYFSDARIDPLGPSPSQIGWHVSQPLFRTSFPLGGIPLVLAWGRLQEAIGCA